MFSGSVSYGQFMEHIKAQPFKMDRLVMERSSNMGNKEYDVAVFFGRKHRYEIPIIVNDNTITYPMEVNPSKNTCVRILVQPKEQIIVKVYFRMYAHEIISRNSKNLKTYK